MMRRLIVLACLMLLAAGPARAKLFDPATFTLDNGLRVVVIHKPTMPAVRHMVWYRVGAMDEPRGKSGMAHLLEHLMFKGTPDHPEGAFSEIVARNGGDQNAFTGRDYTAYYQSIARDRLGLVMRLEADRMTNLRLQPKDVRKEREVVMEERRMRVDNEPAALLSEQMTAVLYLNHPYARPIIGYEDELASITPADLEAFYDTWYAPNNAIVVVSGAAKPGAVKKLAKKHYGDIPRSDLPQRPATAPPQTEAERRVVLRHAQVGQPAFNRRYLAPSYMAGERKYVPALNVLADVLAGNTASRLNKALTVKRSIATSVSAGYGGNARGMAAFGLHAVPAEDVALDRLEKAIDKEIRKVLENGVDEARVKRAKQSLVAEVVYSKDSLSGGAYILGAALTVGRDVASVETWRQAIRDVTVADVNAAARHVLKPGRSVTGLLQKAESGDEGPDRRRRMPDAKPGDAGRAPAPGGGPPDNP